MTNTTLEAIKTRNACAKLSGPAPSDAEINEILDAALRAPDHARLRPWRFVVIQGEGRHRLGEIFSRALKAKQPDVTAEQLDSIASKPLRAPLIITVISKVTEHPKVPEIEQHLSAGCAAMNILLAVEALGYRGIWRTGSMAFDKTVHDGMELAANESIIGYLYVGTQVGELKKLPDLDVDDFVTYWT